jgi:CRISPR-associated protein Cmr4
MEKTFFTIDCKTNLHVGSGKANYGVVDQLVQRDPTFQCPTIHASSLKGGIKEYCQSNNYGNMIKVFGSEKKTDGKTDHENSQVGEYKFFDAMLLAIPVRCDKRAFIHITCPNILKNLNDQLPPTHALKTELKALSEIFGIGENPIAYCFSPDLNDAIVEDFDVKAKYDGSKLALLTDQLKNLFKYDIVIVENKYFDRLTDDLHLPVIARNYLENGESKNLWYEQVVPRLSRFWSMEIHQGADLLFTPVLFNKEIQVQVGANGSIGYGYCSFTKID